MVGKQFDKTVIIRLPAPENARFAVDAWTNQIGSSVLLDGRPAELVGAEVVDDGGAALLTFDISDFTDPPAEEDA